MACFSATLLKLEKLKLKNGREYHEVTITQKRPDGISILHETGTTRIKFEDLPEQLAKKLGGFDPAEAANAREHQQKFDAANDAAIKAAKAANASKAALQRVVTPAQKQDPFRPQQDPFGPQQDPFGPQQAPSAKFQAPIAKDNGLAHAPDARRGSGYFSTIDKTDKKIFLLKNAAAVEITDFIKDFIGHIGLNTKCLLFKENGTFKIWIEGHRTYNCKMLHEPAMAQLSQLEAVTISGVLSYGNFLKLADGRILEVSNYDTIDAQTLTLPRDGLLLDSGELVVLNEGKILKVSEVRE